MGDEFAQYETYIRQGLRVEIGLPLPGGGIFRDWAVVDEYKQDLLLVQLSRDTLPSNVRMDVGFILDVSAWVKKDVYTCSGIVTEKRSDRVIQIRLFGAFTLRERRQFFRLDTNFRLKYSCPDYLHRDEVRDEWSKRRELAEMVLQGYDQVVVASRTAQFQPSQKLTWHEQEEANVTLGGGGIRLKLPKKMRTGELVNLEMHLPLTPPRSIHTVGEVMYTLEPLGSSSEGGKPVYTGLQFAYIHEWDREQIFKYISMVQVERLKQIQNKRPVKDPEQIQLTTPTSPLTWQTIVKRVIYTIMFIALAILITIYFREYRAKSERNEIQEIFDKNIKTYHKN